MVIYIRYIYIYLIVGTIRQLLYKKSIYRESIDTRDLSIGIEFYFERCFVILVLYYFNGQIQRLYYVFSRIYASSQNEYSLSNRRRKRSFFFSLLYFLIPCHLHSVINSVMVLLARCFPELLFHSSKVSILSPGLQHLLLIAILIKNILLNLIQFLALINGKRIVIHKLS